MAQNFCFCQGAGIRRIVVLRHECQRLDRDEKASKLGEFSVTARLKSAEDVFVKFSCYRDWLKVFSATRISSAGVTP